MPIREPIQYTLTPQRITAGQRWLSLRLKNVGDETLTQLDVRLNSLDAYSLNVYGAGNYVAELPPGEETVQHYQVAAEMTGDLYASIDGQQDDQPFHWESPSIQVTVGQQAAELLSVFALTQPHVLLGNPIKCEATVRGLTTSQQLVIEFWVQTPVGTFKSLDKQGLGKVAADEIVRRTVEFTPEHEGIYILHAYLYDGAKRIGHRTEYLSISL